MPDSDELKAAREKVRDWGPDLRRPSAMVRFRADVRELERLVREHITRSFGPGPTATPSEDDDLPADAIIARYSDGSVWTPEQVGEAFGAIVTAAEERPPRPLRPLPDPPHRGRMWSEQGGPWTCVECGWTEGDEPREHEPENRERSR